MDSPERADEMYQSATDWLLANTRDTQKFGLLFEENMNYGFRRNFWALKPLALCIDAAAIIAIGGHAWWTTAEAYARQLLAACDAL
jgi:hypothetical protein